MLPNLVSTGSPEFQAKADAMASVVEDLQSKLAEARLGGGEKDVAKMRKAGKKTPRERYGSHSLRQPKTGLLMPCM